MKWVKDGIYIKKKGVVQFFKFQALKNIHCMSKKRNINFVRSGTESA